MSREWRLVISNGMACIYEDNRQVTSYFAVEDAKRIIGMSERIAELERRNAMLTAELSNIANAKRFDRECFDDDSAFAGWAQSRARHTLSATSADTEAWLQAEILKRLGEPVAWLKTNQHYEYALPEEIERGGEKVFPVYRLPSPLATPEERKE